MKIFRLKCPSFRNRRYQLSLYATRRAECGTCQCPLTVKHILVECVDLKDVRNKHFVASSIKDLFDNIEAHKIILLKKLVFISNFNVFILMFVICFFYSSLIALILHSQVLPSYKLFSYPIHHINLEWH